MNAPPKITYEYLVDELTSRIKRLQNELVHAQDSLLTIKTHPEIVPTIARLIRPFDYDAEQ